MKPLDRDHKPTYKLLTETAHTDTLAQATGKEKDDQPLYPWTATGDALEPSDGGENDRGDP